MDWAQARENVAAWDQIAASFDRTRRKPWEVVLRFLDELPARSKVLDAGTGNGRHAAPAVARGHEVVGLDLSLGLLKAARRNVGAPRSAAWIRGALERLPLKGQPFDAALVLAALHHLRGRAHRRSALEGLLGLLRPGGRLIVSGWARRQPRFADADNPLRSPTRGPVEAGDAMLRWAQDGLSVERFVHLYAFEEFQEEVSGLRWSPRRVWAAAIGAEESPDNYFALFVV